MLFKKKCPNCGAKNPKESVACTECGSAFVLGQVEQWPKGLVQDTAVGAEAPDAGHDRPEARAWSPPSYVPLEWGGEAGAERIHHALYDFPEGPISWVNVWYAGRGGTEDSAPRYYYFYGVPDPRVADIPHEVKAASVCKKAFPLVWRVVDIEWVGLDFGLGIASHLNRNLGVVDPSMRTFEVDITPHLDTSCWLIDGPRGFRSRWRRESPVVPMSGPRWNWLDAIARNLLAWRPSTE